MCNLMNDLLSNTIRRLHIFMQQVSLKITSFITHPEGNAYCQADGLEYTRVIAYETPVCPRQMWS